MVDVVKKKKKKMEGQPTYTSLCLHGLHDCLLTAAQSSLSCPNHSLAIRTNSTIMLRPLNPSLHFVREFTQEASSYTPLLGNWLERPSN